MGFFSTPQGISERELEELFKGIDGLSSVQRAYLQGLFVQYRDRGISEAEIEHALKELRTNTRDGINRRMADKIKEVLHQHLSSDSKR